MSEEIKKEGFFKKVLKSIKDFDKYEDFALEKTGEAFKYLIKLVAILCAIVCIAYTYKIVDNMNKIYIGIKDKNGVPLFTRDIVKVGQEELIGFISYSIRHCAYGVFTEQGIVMINDRTMIEKIGEKKDGEYISR